MAPPSPPQPLTILPFPLEVFLPNEVQPWEVNEEDEEVNSEELQLKAEKDAEDAAYDSFMVSSSRRKRRHRVFQEGSNSSTSSKAKSDANSEESESSDNSDSGDDEGEKVEEDMTLDYPQEDSASEVDGDAYKPRSP